jgi:hypothetical protein|tara:strand:+ start:133 stop:390 length:258 start_codon:yes stop_codon:yes gene_type:complete
MKVTTSIVKTLTSTHIKLVYKNLKIDMCKPLIVEHIFNDVPPKRNPDNDLKFRMVNKMIKNKVIDNYHPYQYDERNVLEEQISSA